MGYNQKRAYAYIIIQIYHLLYHLIIIIIFLYCNLAADLPHLARTQENLLFAPVLSYARTQIQTHAHLPAHTFKLVHNT